MPPCMRSRCGLAVPCGDEGARHVLVRTRRVQRVPRASPQPPSSTTEAENPSKTLDNLDALLGQELLQGQQDQQQQQKQQLPWWRIPPKQAAPPRQGLMTPTSQFGRFIPSGEGLFMRHVRTGKPTLIGQPLDVPRVEPFACYLLAAAQAAVYAAATITNNPQAAAAAGDAPDIPQLALALALHPAAAHTDAWQLATSLLVHSSAPHLVLDLALLLLVAPEVEAVFGHSLLLLLFCCAGVAGSTAAVAAAGGAGADAAGALAGASLGTFGLVGAYLGYCAASPTVASSTHRTNNSSSSSSNGSGGASSKPITPMAAAVAVGVAGTLVLSVFSQAQLSVSPAGHGAALAAGCLAGYLLGPKFVIIQEVDIPEGSMIVPEDALETRVVMDQRSGSSRMLAGLALAAGLAAAIGSVVVQ